MGVRRRRAASPWCEASPLVPASSGDTYGSGRESYVVEQVGGRVRHEQLVAARGEPDISQILSRLGEAWDEAEAVSRRARA